MTLFYNHDPGRADAKAFGDPTGFPPSPVLPLHRTLVSKVPATRIEVDLDSIAKNIQVLKQACGPQTSVMAVVKANAYGHGAVHVAQTALSHGAEWLGVARMAEALKLRDAEIKAPFWSLATPCRTRLRLRPATASESPSPGWTKPEQSMPQPKSRHRCPGPHQT